VYDEMNESVLLDGALQFHDLECDGREFQDQHEKSYSASRIGSLHGYESLIKDMWTAAMELSSDGNLGIGIPPPLLSFFRREEEQAD